MSRSAKEAKETVVRTGGKVVEAVVRRRRSGKGTTMRGEELWGVPAGSAQNHL